MKSTTYPHHPPPPAPVLALRTVTYCTENEGAPVQTGIAFSGISQ